ncbi:zona pellucida-like domain-containing protein [Ditylenchus destructor]|nr:zona pellucida-like domain-containing protein [Ditylenchus destructor]
MRSYSVIYLLSVLLIPEFAQQYVAGSVLDNGVIGDPTVECMEDRVRLTFHTERPFTGRIFVKGMIESDKCVNSYTSNSKSSVDYQLINGQCNMRRSRKLGPDQRGVEQSITIIISFHNVFITKVDRAYRCTCFYMEADKVVTNRFDVSMLPTTELMDNAKMPFCTYSVRRGSVNGPVVTYATVGEPVFHVWSCDSDMFSMLVHNCFVDDGAGKDRKPLIDEHGCTIDPIIVQDLTYNNQANLAYSEVNVFKFADKITTYFQCAVSTCMVSEGMCTGKTPPRCGINSRKRRTITGRTSALNSNSKAENGTPPVPISRDDYVMDLAAEKIVVLDLDDSTSMAGSSMGQPYINEFMSHSAERRTLDGKKFADSNFAYREKSSNYPHPSDALKVAGKIEGFAPDHFPIERVCLSYYAISLLTCVIAFSIMSALIVIGIFIWRRKVILSKY